jgi:mRNA-decapping enzyme subunit 2
MSTHEQRPIPTELLADLCSRFLINLPVEQRDDPVRLFFAVEAAHWYYIDEFCPDNSDLPMCEIKDFAEQSNVRTLHEHLSCSFVVFQHCPFLRPHVKHLLLVRGFSMKESWGFPKGKVQEKETSLNCAIREVNETIKHIPYLHRSLTGDGRSRI